MINQKLEINTIMEEENRLETNDIEEEDYQYPEWEAEQVILQKSVGNTKYIPPIEPSVQNPLFANYVFNNTQILSCQGIKRELTVDEVPILQTHAQKIIVIVPPVPQKNLDVEEIQPTNPTKIVENPTKQNPKNSQISNTILESLPQVLNNEQPNSGKSSETTDKKKRPLKPKKTEKNQQIDQNKTQKRNGTNHQSLTQKIIRKMSNYHFNKNYRQQRDRFAKKVYQQTKSLMTLETFKQKLRLYKPKPAKTSTFIDLFQTREEKQLVIRVYQEAMRRAFQIISESQVRRDLFVNRIPQNLQKMQMEGNQSQSNSQEQQKKEEYAYKCLDEKGDQELNKSFDQVLNKSASEFEKEKQRQGSQISFQISQFKQKLIKYLRS